MRRDYFSLDIRNVSRDDEDDDPEQPTVAVTFDGPASTLRERLAKPDGEDYLAAEETDFAFRLQSGIEAEDATGVVSVTDRLTGDFVLELNEDADEILGLIDAAREYAGATGDDDGHYHVVVRIDGETVVEYDKDTFLVYDEEGNLLRQHSLIPSGVEL
jgi:hypothetical protein